MIPPDLRADAGIRFAAAHVLLIIILLLAGACRLTAVETEIVVGTAMALYCTRLPLVVRPVIGAISWAFVTGFVVNGLGELTFGRADLLRLGVLVVGCSALATAWPLVADRTGRLVA